MAYPCFVISGAAHPITRPDHSNALDRQLAKEHADGLFEGVGVTREITVKGVRYLVRFGLGGLTARSSDVGFVRPFAGSLLSSAASCPAFFFERNYSYCRCL